jgi:hypothetical protein
MKAVWILLFVAIGFFSGLFWGRKQNSPSAIVTETTICEASAPACPELDQLKEKLSGITPEEVRQYLKTQDADQKLRKADEILGKIMQLLVAQVGFQLQKEDLQDFGKIPEKVVDNQPPPAPVPLPRTVEANAATTAPRRPVFTVQMQNTRSEETARRLVMALGPDINDRVHQAHEGLTAEQIQILNGTYDGTVVMDKDRSTRRGMLYIDAQMRRKEVFGKWTLELSSEDGKDNSRNNGSGNMTSRFSGNENEIFLETSQKNQFQLVYFPNLDQWMGNYLESNRGVYKTVGFAVFKRR